MKGVVFSIERCCVHDGPGIRTIVFLKGCPLRCLWCCNPEGQSKEPVIIFRDEECIGCRGCVEVCPNSAIIISGKGELVTRRENCDKCGRCTEICPTRARVLMGKSVSKGYVLEEILRDSSFYANSNGGVTLSGGEPLFQPSFCEEVLKNCKQVNLHTAIETCGMFQWKKAEDAIRYTDLFLYDIKHMDPSMHKGFTGFSNKDILENARRIASLEKEVTIRIPLIPGFNITKENLRATCDFARELKVVREIHLLPYHRLGVSKYKRLGMRYRFSARKAPRLENLNWILQLFRDKSFTVHVGG